MRICTGNIFMGGGEYLGKKIFFDGGLPGKKKFF